VTNGLANSTLKTLLNAITSTLLDQTTQNAVIKCFYPAESVSSDLVYCIVSSLGHGTLKASMPTQQALIKWLIMVHELLEDNIALSRCYGVLFNLLDSTSLRADLCHLLSIITRKKHVKPFRILLLNNLSHTVGYETALQKLTLAYEEYAPGSLDVEDFPKKAWSGFAHPDAEWAQLEKIHQIAKLRAKSPTIDAPATVPGNTFKSMKGLDDSISNLSKPLSTKLTLSDVGSRIFQKRASLMPADVLAPKLDSLLSPLFEQELKKLEGGRGAGKALSDILEKVLDFTTSTKVCSSKLIGKQECILNVLRPYQSQLYNSSRATSANGTAKKTRK